MAEFTVAVTCLAFFLSFSFSNNRKIKWFLVFQVYCAISTTPAPRIPATRARSATQARSMDRSLAPAPPVTRGSTARRTSTSASRVSNRVSLSSLVWKVLRLGLRFAQLRKWSRFRRFFFFPFFPSSFTIHYSPGIVINDSLDSKTTISLSNEKNIRKIVSYIDFIEVYELCCKTLEQINEAAFDGRYRGSIRGIFE